jgi:RNA recognition motif-containing protein
MQQQTSVENVSATGAEPQADDDPDDRSVFVKNVDFQATEQQLIEHFHECGEISRVTIRKDKHTQQSIG